ncbi:MAG TPA: flagellin [Terracidiphilus sp.]|jgi:flagellin|nr:flagellin [Terracidiphilus sp.]
MSLGILNNLSAMYAANNLNNTQNSLSKTLQQLSSGSKINSGADDAAGLSLVNGLQANATALSQSQTNVTEGVGLLQVADGALSQVTNLLNRAVTLATEASNGTLNTAQLTAADQEFQSILGEIDNIGATTTFNGQVVFGGATDVAIYTGDSTTTSATTDTIHLTAIDTSAGLGDTAGAVAYAAGAFSYTATAGQVLAGDVLTANASTVLTHVHDAINDIAAQDGYVGAQINTLNAMSQVISTQQQNIVAAQNAVQATDYASASSNMSKYQILSQTGISALAQANSMQQMVLKLLQ